MVKRTRGHADIHGYRRDYAQALYAQVNGAPYVKWHPNHDALMIVSNALGHSREDVVIRNYL